MEVETLVWPDGILGDPIAVPIADAPHEDWRTRECAFVDIRVADFERVWPRKRSQLYDTIKEATKEQRAPKPRRGYIRLWGVAVAEFLQDHRWSQWAVRQGIGDYHPDAVDDGPGACVIVDPVLGLEAVIQAIFPNDATGHPVRPEKVRVPIGATDGARPDTSGAAGSLFLRAQ